MNSKIRELAIKAGAYEWGDSTIPATMDIEKFAELILEECCNWIDGSPSTDAGQLLLTKSFIIANIKNISKLNNFTS
jgi:hypothetical protein